MAICMYDEHARADREAAALSYAASTDFACLCAEAKARGFRKASIQEIHASAESVTGATDLHCWRGGLWVAINAQKEPA